MDAERGWSNRPRRQRVAVARMGSNEGLRGVQHDPSFGGQQDLHRAERWEAGADAPAHKWPQQHLISTGKEIHSKLGDSERDELRKKHAEATAKAAAHEAAAGQLAVEKATLAAENIRLKKTLASLLGSTATEAHAGRAGDFGGSKPVSFTFLNASKP
eukprot:SAG31_NODE_5339_length_2600_cov_2.395442_2_plen_158_part_00